MTWKESSAMTEKIKFIATYKEQIYSFTDLCNQFGISRKTGYKLINRYDAYGIDGLKERSRAHKSHPNETCDEIKEIILQIKNKYPHWGPKKIYYWLQSHKSNIKIPAISTIGSILDKHGLVKPRKKRPRVAPYTEPFIECTSANSVWSADFKGQFKLGNGNLCYPLTISDNYSRYLIHCKGLHNPTLANTKICFETAFKKYGLPAAIKTDNGVPFASNAIAGLSKLSVWWIKLGIIPERIKAGHPEQNGRHERMHRTLKAYTAKSPRQNIKLQQSSFDEFMDEYNHIRPHESLSGKTPINLYHPSIREFPDKLPKIEYDYTVRKVRTNGEIKWQGKLFYLAQLLYGEPVGLTETDDGKWSIYYSTIMLGTLDLRKNRIIRHA